MHVYNQEQGMIDTEPVIGVGIVQKAQNIAGELSGNFQLEGRGSVKGRFTAEASDNGMVFKSESGDDVRAERLLFKSAGEGAKFSLDAVTIGVDFHWQQKELETFTGDLTLCVTDGGVTAINTLPLEDYLVSVISSEMNAGAPQEFLKAHAIMSRSWLTAMLERQNRRGGETGPIGFIAEEDEVIRWYGREQHTGFDVCADDHCQRYRGLGSVADGAEKACAATRGVFLTYGGVICDARYHKCCGGLTERYATAWEDIDVPYLSSVPDAEAPHQDIRSEEDARSWIMSAPDAFCNTCDEGVLRQILPLSDRDTMDFFRWRLRYEREELEDIIRSKTGVDFGALQGITALERGPSGRILRLRIQGSKRTMTFGKELEIRRILSQTHLYSSAFVVEAETDGGGEPAAFVFHGAGWGHGVGLCQIGGAVMAHRGYRCEDILRHYFKGADLSKLY